MCVLFPLALASVAPTEQLVLTTIRQEASDLQDPGPGTVTTMRAGLADRFDKSEFARSGLDDALLPTGPSTLKVHVKNSCRAGVPLPL